MGSIEIQGGPIGNAILFLFSGRKRGQIQVCPSLICTAIDACEKEAKAREFAPFGGPC